MNFKKLFNPKSVRAKLFFTLCIVIIMIVLFLVVANSAILEAFYYYKKVRMNLDIFNYVNTEVPKDLSDSEGEKYLLELEKLSENNNFELLLKDGDNIIYSTSLDYTSDFELNDIPYDVDYRLINKSDLMYARENINIRKTTNRKTGINYVVLDSVLDNGNTFYIRMSERSVKDNIEVSDNFIYLMGIAAIIMGGFAIVLITEKFTKPIEELSDIADEMAKLNFKRKYRINDSRDEIDELGKSINTLSDKLENTILELQKSNSELEKDIEEKSKIDEMRKQFISDVSHELKTPIALIQGYAEGLVENIASDEESRKYYSEVILDEANKMDKLVKSLLELMKLEYGAREFNDTKFDLVDMIQSDIRNLKVMLEENKIQVEFKAEGPMYAYADDFYINQVITNYLTNAIKNNDQINGKKLIKITIKEIDGKYRITVYNTGHAISQENLNRIWTRFYKVDSSRNRSKGGTGIGLSLVKAIQTKYNAAYGVKNKKDGVEFFFDVAIAKGDK